MTIAVTRKGTLTRRRCCAIRELAALGQDAVDVAVLLNISTAYAYGLAAMVKVKLAARPHAKVYRDDLKRLMAKGLTNPQMAERLGKPVGSIKVIAWKLRQEQRSAA